MRRASTLKRISGVTVNAHQTSDRMAVKLGGRTYNVSAKRQDFAEFWKNAEAGQWEEDTFRFLDAVGDRAATLVDVGAWIGPISLYASPRVGRVLALEPDALSHETLTANVTANADNVEIWNVAVDVKEGVIDLYPTAWFGSSSNPDFGTGADPIPTRTVTFEAIDAAVGAAEKVILKVDIEGHEFHVLEPLMAFAKRRRAATHLSLHPRAVWFEGKKGLAARRRAFAASMDAIKRLAGVGPVVMSITGRPATWLEVFPLIFLKRRPKNFSVEVREPFPA